MAGYNRDIVATRKLNKKNKARLGRKGDTKIREVEGRDSHVNALEAYLIDVNGRVGEDYAKRVGAGTINPLTGMKEYHPPELAQGERNQYYYSGPHDDSEHTHPQIVDSTMIYNPDHDWGQVAGELQDWQQQPSNNNLNNYQPLSGRQDYETLSDLSSGDLEKYLRSEFGMAADSMEYIKGFQEEPFGFIGEQQKLTTGRALETKEFTEKGLLASKEAAGREAEVATAGVQETLTGARESLGREFAAGSRGIGSGMTQARAGAETAAARSGFARSGTVTGALGQQMKTLTQDYGQLQKGRTQGMAGAGRRADIGLAGVAAGQKTAAETYALGMEGAAADYDFSIAGADLDFRQAEYLEKQRQKDLFYEDIRAIKSWG